VTGGPFSINRFPSGLPPLLNGTPFLIMRFVAINIPRCGIMLEGLCSSAPLSPSLFFSSLIFFFFAGEGDLHFFVSESQRVPLFGDRFLTPLRRFRGLEPGAFVFLPCCDSVASHLFFSLLLPSLSSPFSYPRRSSLSPSPPPFSPSVSPHLPL